jgi:hypothetical protein
MRTDQGWFWVWPVFNNKIVKSKKQIDLIFMALRIGNKDDYSRKYPESQVKFSTILLTVLQPKA